MYPKFPRKVTSVPQSMIQQHVAVALDEDRHAADRVGCDTISWNFAEKTEVKAKIFTRESMVMCGCRWVEEVCAQVDPKIVIHWCVEDAEQIEATQTLCTLQGRAHSLLVVERCALNFLQFLSGTATVTRAYVNELSGTQTHLLDTRKTIPGFRLAQKYAVQCGGGYNHRLGLYDAVLIKENHIRVAGSIRQALAQIPEKAKLLPCILEVETLQQVNEALELELTWLMLDNFSLTNMCIAVQEVAGRATLEASGNVSLKSLRAIAQTGVDYISVGHLTKHVRAIDLSMILIDIH